MEDPGPRTPRRKTLSPNPSQAQRTPVEGRVPRTGPSAPLPIRPRVGQAAGRAGGRAEREALADIRDGLERDDPALARSLDRLTGPSRSWPWWAGGLGVLLLAAAAVWALGPPAVGALGILLVLGSPLLVGLCCGVDELVEQPPEQPDGS